MQCVLNIGIFDKILICAEACFLSSYVYLVTCLSVVQWAHIYDIPLGEINEEKYSSGYISLVKIIK